MNFNNPELEEDLYRILRDHAGINSPVSYADHKRLAAANIENTYYAAVNNAMTQRGLNRSGYGRNAERLASGGLSNSGYAAYLDSLADKTAGDSISRAKAAAINEEREHTASYAKYLDNLEEKKSTLRSEVLSAIVDNEIIDLDTSYAFAVESGLSALDASAVSMSAYNFMKNKIYKECLELVVRNDMTPSGAKLYAMRMGLNEKDAVSLQKEAARLQGDKPDQSYVDYLENLSNKSTITFN